MLLPCVTFGYSPHHIDGPGTLTVRWDTFIDYVRQIAVRAYYDWGFNVVALDLRSFGLTNLTSQAPTTVG